MRTTNVSAQFRMIEPTEPPIACTLKGDEQVGRRARWLRLVDRALISQAVTGRGVELCYRADSGVRAELEELAKLERDCCGFASWRIIEREETILLAVETDPKHAAVLREMFSANSDGRTVLP